MSLTCSSAQLSLCEDMSDATILLTALDQGDPQAAEKLLELVYEELRRLAASKMAREAPGQTLQPTALVHEAWLRLVGDKNPRFENRAHFFSAAAEAMRRILIDRARRKLTQRHGGGVERVDLDGQDLAAPGADQQLLAVHEVLDKFATVHPVQAELVKLRYFAGMTNEETAQILDISVSTAKNYWTFARTWIYQEIKNS
jgi:RNA polymerase sigma factor (TIGR02999 family)